MFDPQGPTFFELARQALSSTEHGYDLLAPKFDHTPFRTPQFIIDGVEQSLASEGPFRDGVDLCCGTGIGVEMLQRLCTRTVVGVDFSQGMLSQANQSLNPGDGSSVGFCRCDVLNLPFAGAFDIAVSFGAFGHVLPRDEVRFVQQINHVLKSGGIFAFVSHEMPSMANTTYWFARGFNLAMHIRNAIIRPSFIMYYLTFLLPETIDLLENHGFDVTLHNPFKGRHSFLKVVIARKRVVQEK